MPERLVVHYRNPGFEQAIAALGLDGPETLFRWSGGDLLGTRRHGSLVRAELQGLGRVYLKRYEYPRARPGEMLIGSIACREWRNSGRMARLGIPQPEVILAATRRNRWGVLGSCLLTREVPAAGSLADLLQQGAAGPLSGPGLAALVTELLALIRRMHAAGFCHWDLKPRNILVVEGRGGPVLMPIDSVNGRRIHGFNRRHCIRRDYRFLLADPRLGPLLARTMRTRSPREAGVNERAEVPKSSGQGAGARRKGASEVRVKFNHILKAAGIKQRRRS